MKCNEIIILTSFTSLDAYYNANKNFLNLLSNEFNNIYIVNSENLKIFWKNKKFKKKSFLKFPKKINFINPKNFKELDYFIQGKKPLIINNIKRKFEFYKLLSFISKRKIPQILIGDTGNIQASVYFWHGYNNFRLILNFFTTLLPRWISRLLVFFKIFSPIDIRFTSNRKHYEHFIKKSKQNFFIKFPSYFKKWVLVKSRIFDSFDKKSVTALSEEYILLLDQEPEYREMKEVSILDKNLIKEHYEKMNRLLLNLSKTFKKEVIISIHPLYDLKRTSRRFKNYKVVRMQTTNYIKKSFLVLFFDSSAILPAFILKKKIICVQADLFKGRRYNSDLYKDYLDLKSLNINDDLKINKNKFIKDLNNKTKYYKNHLNNYSASNLAQSGSENIINHIKRRYF
jgi:hypothetical protein